MALHTAGRIEPIELRGMILPSVFAGPMRANGSDCPECDQREGELVTEAKRSRMTGLEMGRNAFIGDRVIACGQKTEDQSSWGIGSVAEHLHEEAAPTIARSLVELAPVVLFSAAIPVQGGVAHVNEQWPEYWSSLFAEHGSLCREEKKANQFPKSHKPKKPIGNQASGLFCWTLGRWQIGQIEAFQSKSL